MDFYKFPSIERFHNVKKAADRYAEHYPAKLVYRGKIKLHGTNAAVVVTTNGNVYGQKRSSVVTVDADNYGFAKFVEDTEKDWLASLSKAAKHYNKNIVVYGEWFGPGVQKGVACSQVDQKQFAIFAIGLEGDSVVVEPQDIESIMGVFPELLEDMFGGRVHILPFHYQLVVELFNVEQLKEVIENLNDQIEKIDEVDPWIESKFGIEGTGEGLVFYPVNLPGYPNIDRDLFSKLTFKAKGQKHEVVKTKRKAVEIDPEVLENQNKFVEMFVTENRLKQIAEQACNNDFDMRKIGDFLKAFGQDVHKESKAELEASGIDWKDVSKAITKAAQRWYITECKRIV